MARAYEGYVFGPISADTDVFNLRGGKYAVSAVGDNLATDNGFTLEYKGPDGITFIPYGDTSAFVAAGVVVLDLPPGEYKFVLVGSADDSYVQVVRIPND